MFQQNLGSKPDVRLENKLKQVSVQDCIVGLPWDPSQSFLVIRTGSWQVGNHKWFILQCDEFRFMFVLAAGTALPSTFKNHAIARATGFELYFMTAL